MGLRELVAEAISRVRDRRRRFRKSMEEYFGRQFFASVVVGGHVVAVLRTGPYAIIAPSEDVKPVLFGTLLAGTAFWIVVVVYWHRLAEAAQEAADKAEDAVDPDD